MGAVLERLSKHQPLVTRQGTIQRPVHMQPAPTVHDERLGHPCRGDVAGERLAAGALRQVGLAVAAVDIEPEGLRGEGVGGLAAAVLRAERGAGMIVGVALAGGLPRDRGSLGSVGEELMADARRALQANDVAAALRHNSCEEIFCT